MAYRNLSTEEFKKVDPANEFGPAPMMEWIKLDLLVIDETFQRTITATGKTNVATIIRTFNWSKFSPVLVAPVEGGRYSVIDGQHRATAALACGIEMVPCQIIQANQREQAEAFAAVNVVRTNMQPVTLYHARLAAGDPDALRMSDVCARAGVEIPRMPQSSKNLKPHQFQSPSTTFKLIDQYGEDVVVTTLKALVETGVEGDHRLTNTNFKALAAVLWAHRDWCEAGGELFDILDKVDFDELRSRAKETHKTIGGSVSGHVTSFLERKLERLFSKEADQAA